MRIIRLEEKAKARPKIGASGRAEGPRRRLGPSSPSDFLFRFVGQVAQRFAPIFGQKRPIDGFRQRGDLINHDGAAQRERQFVIQGQLDQFGDGDVPVNRGVSCAVPEGRIEANADKFTCCHVGKYTPEAA